MIPKSYCDFYYSNKKSADIDLNRILYDTIILVEKIYYIIIW